MRVYPVKKETRKIEVQNIRLHHVRVPLCEPFRISNGEVTEKEAILVEIQTSAGVTGWGESSPMSGSFYSGETPEGSWQVLIEKLLPLVLESPLVEPENFYQFLSQISGEAFAKAGLEGALWDALAQEQNIPLYQLLGAKTAAPIISGAAIGIYDSLKELLQRVQKFIDAGYQRIKIKIHPGWDTEPVRAIRRLWPKLPLMVDANTAYNKGDFEVFRTLDRFDLLMIEQPFARTAFEFAAELQSAIKTPLCADESAESLTALEEIIHWQAARIINIKVQRVGGLSEAIKMFQRASEANLDCWVGTMPELGVASAQGLHFAALGGFKFPTDIEASIRWYLDDVIEPMIEIDTNGIIRLPERSGNGFQINRAKIDKYCLKTSEFKV